MEGNCDIEVDPEVKIPIEKFTVQSCMVKCGMDPACMYYEFVYKDNSCLMYKRPVKSCQGFLGAPERELKTCGNVFCRKLFKRDT